jgi:hypothetical protein
MDQDMPSAVGKAMSEAVSQGRFVLMKGEGHRFFLRDWDLQYKQALDLKETPLGTILLAIRAIHTDAATGASARPGDPVGG